MIPLCFEAFGRLGAASRKTMVVLAMEAHMFGRSHISAARLEARLQSCLESVLLFEKGDLLQALGHSGNALLR